MLRIASPEKPLTLDQVHERWPKIRQSWAAAFDDCALTSYFNLRYQAGLWGTVPAAMGQLLHRTFSECLREMQRMDSETIPVGIALAILEEMLEQRGVPAEERVRIPLREVPTMRWVTVKFARDNSFTIRNLIDIERELEAVIDYTDDDGQLRHRTLTGRPDALIAEPDVADGAIVIDWKTGWRPPPEPRSGEWEDADVSYHGLFQLTWYAFLVLRNYPAVKRVTLREFYARRTVARKATITRDDLPAIEQQLATLVLEMDRALMSGKPKRLRLPDVAPWTPSPGKHCANCLAPHLCPIEADARERYAITSPKRARQGVAELQVAEAIRKNRREGLEPYVHEHGPVPAKWGEARLVLGLRTQKGGKQVLTFFVPEGSDRAPERQPEDVPLEQALRRAAEAVRDGDDGDHAPAPERPGEASG